MSFDRCMHKGNHHLNMIQNISITPETSLMALCRFLPSPPYSLPQANTYQFSITIN